jgi:hypothetical protein
MNIIGLHATSAPNRMMERRARTAESSRHVVEDKRAANPAREVLRQRKFNPSFAPGVGLKKVSATPFRPSTSPARWQQRNGSCRRSVG